AAVGLLVAAMLVALAVFSYDPTDPPSGTLHPPRAKPNNLLEIPGAWLAHGLFESLGLAVYGLLATWFVLVTLLFLRRRVVRWSIRLAGWTLLVPLAAVLANMFGPETVGDPITGSGGSLGAWLANWLRDHFQPQGRGAFLIAFGAIALLLSVDFAIAGLAYVAWH